MKGKTLTMAVAVAAVTLSAATQAKVLWSDNSVTYLQGDDYKLPMSGDNTTFGQADTTESRQLITIEHASGHSWGDLFYFSDFIRSNDGDKAMAAYSEIQPRFSLGKLTGKAMKFGPVSDVLVATQVEINVDNTDLPTNSFINTLVGFGVDLQVPGFDFVQINAYARQNDLQDNNFQLTPVWATSWHIGPARFVLDGFIDYTSGNDDLAAMFHTQTQLKWDMGKNLFGEEKKLYLGIEYEYWNNKFGVKDGVQDGFWRGGKTDTDESNVQFMVKYHL